MTEEDAYNELCGYTLTHSGSTFVHQYVVDAFAAQQATPQTKPIKLTFALVGLYLHLVKGFTGRQVQHAHMTLAKRKQLWPTFPLPPTRGAITAIDVMQAPEGPERDRAIDAWCNSVWQEFRDSGPVVIALLKQYGIT